MDESFMFEQFYPEVEERFDIAYWPDGLYAETGELLKDYEIRGCFYFEPDTLARLESMDRDAVCSFALQEFTPSGWNEDGQEMLWLLQGREGVDLGIAIADQSMKSLCLAEMSLETLSVLSDSLPGRYLVRFADETLLAGYKEVLRLNPETGEVTVP